jgi:hypothetical protein
MNLRRTLLLGTVGFVAAITALQLWLNPTTTEKQRFRVGFLPVT